MEFPKLLGVFLALLTGFCLGNKLRTTKQTLPAPTIHDVLIAEGYSRNISEKDYKATIIHKDGFINTQFEEIKPKPKPCPCRLKNQPTLAPPQDLDADGVLDDSDADIDNDGTVEH